MRKLLRGIVAATAAIFALAPAAPAHAQGVGGECKVPNVSGVWEGTVEGESPRSSGEVTLFIEQRHRHFSWVANSNGVIVAQGNGAIAAGGADNVATGHAQGKGAPDMLLKHVSATGDVTFDPFTCFATQTVFEFVAHYGDGTTERGVVQLPVHLPGEETCHICVLG